MSKIHIIEDENFIANIMRVNLQEAGYEVLISTNGKEALEDLKKTTPDLILLDLIMPVMDGFELLNIIKKDDNLKDIPIIVTTNLNQQEDIDKVKALGITKYIVKSDISMTDLADIVKKYL